MELRRWPYAMKMPQLLAGILIWRMIRN